jgi:hypothetical protein
MGSKGRWAGRPTLISILGLAASIVLSIGLILLGVDRPGSIIIGIGTTIIGLLIDLAVRIDQAEEQIIIAGRLSDRLVADEYLFGAIDAIVADYGQVATTAEFDIFRDRARHVLEDCQTTLHDLIEGFMTVAPLSQYSFGVKGLTGVSRNLKATSYVDAEHFWNSVAGGRYFLANVELFDRGIAITRVFIGDRATLARIKPIVLRHRNAGIHVLVALTDELPLELCEDYLIADDRIVVSLELTREGIARSERISVQPQRIAKAINDFERLIGGAHEYEEIFPN